MSTRKWINALFLALLITGTVAFFLAPKPKGVGLRSFTSNAAGDTLTLSWVYRAVPLPSSDTALVTWSTKALGQSSYTTVSPINRTRATNFTRAIPLPAVSDTVQACVRVKRVGSPNDSPTSCAKRFRVAPPEGVDSLEISRVIIRPDSVQLLAGATQQFCAVAQMSDGSYVLAENSPSAFCVPLYPEFSVRLSAESPTGFEMTWFDADTSASRTTITGLATAIRGGKASTTFTKP